MNKKIIADYTKQTDTRKEIGTEITKGKKLEY